MFTGVFKDRTRPNLRLSAEEALAQLLQAKSLRRYHFARRCEIGPFTIEHVCRELSLIVELRSQLAINEAREQSRIAFLNEMGYRVLQVSRRAVLEQPDQVIAQIGAALR